MDLVNRNCDEVSGGVLVYFDASDLQRMSENWYEPDIPAQEHLREKANRVMGRPPEEFEPEGLYIEDGCNFCDHTRACGEMMQHAPDEMDIIKEAERVMKDVFK